MRDRANFFFFLKLSRSCQVGFINKKRETEQKLANCFGKVFVEHIANFPTRLCVFCQGHHKGPMSADIFYDFCTDLCHHKGPMSADIFYDFCQVF